LEFLHRNGDIYFEDYEENDGELEEIPLLGDQNMFEETY
jgi:hypothetical protein